MIDLEPDIFTQLATALRAVNPGILVTSEVVAAPSKFPCVSIVEQDNATLARTQTQEPQENHATVMYQIDVFSNKAAGKRSECKAIFAIIDTEMQNMGFTRLFLNPTSNLEDASIHRMTGRYQAVTSQDKIIYRK